MGWVKRCLLDYQIYEVGLKWNKHSALVTFCFFTFTVVSPTWVSRFPLHFLCVFYECCFWVCESCFPQKNGHSPCTVSSISIPVFWEETRPTSSLKVAIYDWPLIETMWRLRQIHRRRLQSLHKMQHILLLHVRLPPAKLSKEVSTWVPHVWRRIHLGRNSQGAKDWKSVFTTLLKKRSSETVQWLYRAKHIFLFSACYVL